MKSPAGSSEYILNPMTTDKIGNAKSTTLLAVVNQAGPFVGTAPLAGAGAAAGAGADAGLVSVGFLFCCFVGFGASGAAVSGFLFLAAKSAFSFLFVSISAFFLSAVAFFVFASAFFLSNAALFLSASIFFLSPSAFFFSFSAVFFSSLAFLSASFFALSASCFCFLAASLSAFLSLLDLPDGPPELGPLDAPGSFFFCEFGPPPSGVKELQYPPWR